MITEKQLQEFKPRIVDAPLNEFHGILTTHDTTVFCYKFQEVLDVESITIRQEQRKYQMFDLYLFNYLSILSAYLFYVPGHHVELFNAYVKIIQPSARQLKMFNGVKMIMQDNKINVFHSDDGATLISVNGLKDIIKPYMIRKSEKNQQEEDYA